MPLRRPPLTATTVHDAPGAGAHGHRILASFNGLPLLGVPLPMPAPLSLDLRQRIVEAYQCGEGPIDEIAERFSVGHATVERLLALERTTGSIEPRPHGGGTEPAVRAEDKPLLLAWRRENPSITQEELAQRYAEATGRAVCQQTISRALERLEITRKQRPSTPGSATGRR